MTDSSVHGESAAGSVPGRPAIGYFDDLHGLEAVIPTDALIGRLLDGLLAASGAQAAGIALLDPTGEWVEVVGAAGFDEGTLERFSRFRVDSDLPLAETIRTERAIWLTEPENAPDRWEPFREEISKAGRRSAACLPLVQGSRVVGGVSFSFDVEQAFDDEQTSAMRALVDECAVLLAGSALSSRWVRLGPAVEGQRDAEERARARLAFLSAATRELGRSLDQQQVIQTLTELVVPRFADWASVLLAEGEQLVAATLVHRDDGVTTAEDRRGRYRIPVAAVTPATRAFLENRPVIVTGVDREVEERMEAFPELAEQLAQTEARVVVPIASGETVHGIITLAWQTSDRHLESEDVTVATELAARAATALDNAKRFAAQRTMAALLQEAVLPKALPTVPGVRMAARYLPAVPHARVGGDWFDAFPLRDGRVGVCVGDVVGHGIPAAARMGQLRQALRVYAIDGSPPGEVLGDLNRFSFDTEAAEFTTLVYATYEPGSGELQWASAGHPPLLHLTRDGARFLEGRPGVPLGVLYDAVYQTYAQPGVDGTLLLYTDGLVEERHLPVDEGLEQLRRTAEELAGRDVEELCDEIIRRVAPQGRNDDICLLALEVVP